MTQPEIDEKTLPDPFDFEHLCGPKVDGPGWSHTVVLLNGLKGGTRKVWTPRTGDPWWNRFSADLGNATIISYNISQKPIRLSRSKETPLERNSHGILTNLRDRGILNKRTVFIGYSFGGILLKRMLADMVSNSYFEPRYANVTALAFLGVPHQGSRWAMWALFFFRPFGTVHLKDLKPKSRTLESVGNDFKRAFAEKFVGTSLVSLLEGRRITIGSLLASNLPAISERLAGASGWITSAVLNRPIYKKVVEDVSAELGLPNETVLRADGCHLSLPWFAYDGAESVMSDLISALKSGLTPRGESAYSFDMITRRIEPKE